MRESLHKRYITLNCKHINIDVELHYRRKTREKKKTLYLHVFSECYIRKINDNLYQAIPMSFQSASDFDMTRQEKKIEWGTAHKIRPIRE